MTAMTKTLTERIRRERGFGVTLGVLLTLLPNLESLDALYYNISSDGIKLKSCCRQCNRC